MAHLSIIFVVLVCFSATRQLNQGCGVQTKKMLFVGESMLFAFFRFRVLHRAPDPSDY